MFSRNDFFSRRHRTGAGASLESMPGIRLEQINPLGLIFSAGLPCEPGTSWALGIHLLKTNASSQFLQVQASVVDCRPVESDVMRSGRYRITLLFHGLTKRQAALLAASGSPPFPGGVSCSGFDDFPPVCGLN